MLTSIWAALACGRCLRFPTGPMVFEMAKGEALAVHHRLLQEATAEDSAALGWWWNGRNRYAVDSATLISPNMASRWIGYLNQSEHWTYGQLRSRWKELAGKLNGKVTFIVQISAFPKLDLFEWGIGVDAEESSLQLGRCVLTYPKPISRALDPDDNLTTNRTDGREDCEVTPLVKLRSDDWRRLMKPYWTALVPDLAALNAEGTCSPSPYEYCLGDYHTEYFLVQAPLTEELAKAPKLSLNFFGGKKDRVAEFSLHDSRH